MFVVTVFDLGMALVFLILGIALGILHRRIIGANSYHLRPRQITTLLGILVLTPWLGLGTGVAITNITESGLFTPWQTINNPPFIYEEKFQHILVAYPESIFIETTRGDGFHLDVGTWLSNHQTNWTRRRAGEFGRRTRIFFEPCEVWFIPPPLLGTIHRVSTRRCMLSYQVSQTDYALMNDNSIRIWHRSVVPDSFPNYTLVFGMLGGFGIGLGIVFHLERKFVDTLLLSNQFSG